MKKQLKGRDGANLYLADGIMKLYSLGELEVLLLETSNHFGSQDKAKASFDHRKDLFDDLSMLKTIADEFHLGTIETCFKLKMFFVHAAGRSVSVWSMRHAMKVNRKCSLINQSK
ncbi:hypothetical protein RO3G_14897 [Rhizopus delemar RA 99-880]|uniref:Uncharacterized protein n=1 Tax=Rhizopus delemar (strain RA 99-880 / ATCC MYA-4621 / FGSC 9543 / NRRL 43880) TaxID=246409 RepID=I1CP06_RHIO9|nr:hypothetical protein RO3G_14897 [Rhizopus delemar RA 99-880]|eukprot:EIE90186.1 hypothetical protein RO3G_14897 [Rhizopus delemar RA 99-880]